MFYKSQHTERKIPYVIDRAANGLICISDVVLQQTPKCKQDLSIREGLSLANEGLICIYSDVIIICKLV